MSLRRRLSFTRNRRDMEKTNGGTCRHQVWFVIFGSFLLWFFLFYFNSVAFTSSKNKVQSIINSVMSPEPISELVNENRTRRTSPIVMENEKEMAENLNKQVSRDNKDEPVIELPVKHDRTDDKTLITSEREKSRSSGTENGDEQVSEVLVEENREEAVINRSDVTENGTTLENRTEPLAKKQTDIDNRSGRQAKPDILDPCSGRYVYVHDLPTRFNSDMIKNCRTLSLWADMCPYISNSGLGQRIGHSNGAFIGKGWFTTDQFTLDVIFHNRMKQYKCLTNNSSMASAIFVPFYAGLDITRYLWGYNTSTRDAASLDLFKWLTSKPEWKVLGGRDHFLVAGRIAWDFRRLTDEDSDWGNKLGTLPEGKNMSLLVLEKSPWHRNDFAIPYPTYFHPSSDNEVFQWQNRMRRLKKRNLFSFAGAPRPNMTDSIRGQIIHQCQVSKNCKLLDCGKGIKLCYKPSNVMKLFQSSIFCLQPPGDSYTRKSAFDSILAGCIPVFFHPGSAYIQYIWHLPKDYTKYSVLISENDVREGKVNIESVLNRIPKEKVIAMREEVIRLIPKLIYADPRSRLETFEDAFDVAVKGVIERVDKVRMELREGRDIAATYKEENTWKYNLFGTEEKHEWDDLFRKPENS